MKLKQFLVSGSVLVLTLTSCIDDNYDLSDIDTTSEFKVKDLVIPVNLDPVVLSDIIRIKEGDELKEVTLNGNTFYAIEQNGEFESDGIDVNPFTAESNKLNPHTAVFRPQSGIMSRRKAGSDSQLYLLVEPVIENLSYTASDIDGSIRELTLINFKPLNFNINIQAEQLAGNVDMELENMELKLPEGLSVTNVSAGQSQFNPQSYNPATGILNLERVQLVNNSVDVTVTAESVDLNSYMPKPFSYNEITETGSFDLESNFNITDGRLKISGEASEIAKISEVTFNVNYHLENLEATSILGSIAYDLKGTGLDIDPIKLMDMPDFLDDPETDLVLSNPQIFLQLSNPIGRYGLGYQSSLDIIAKRQNEDKTFTSPLIKVPATTGYYNFLLAPYPEKISNIPSKFNNSLDRLQYNGLGTILAGNGLPQTLDIRLIDPMIPEQKVKVPFELGKSIDGMKGEYMFLAPLSLAEGSTIVKKVDGWWSEDLADLNIDYLTISTDATNGLSTGVILNIYAIDRDGNRISSEGSVKLEENAADTPISVTLTGVDGKPFNNLDGIKIYVIAGVNQGVPLAPDQIITLENIKAKVTGNYTRKL